MTESPKPSRTLLDRGVIIALISLAGTIVVAYLSHINARMQVEAPIHATQTAEAQATALALATVSAFRPSPTETFPVTTPSISPLPPPIFGDFVICLVKCNGFNSINTFPEKTSVINAQWNYQNVPAGAAYERTWSLGVDLWVKYACVWDGPSEGIERISMIEDRGFHSGTWTMTIKIDGTVVMQETVFIEGNWDYWDPAGEFDFCPAPGG
ncbi:MAG: hypothetical protein ACK2UB_02690 [Anaerolineales bacterium]|jgi:hypothetical protein